MYVSVSSATHLGKLKLYDSKNSLQGATYRDVNEDQKHSLGDECALDKVAHFLEGRAVSIKQSLVLSTALTLV